MRAGLCAGAGLALGSAGLSCCPWCSKKQEPATEAAADDLPQDWTMIAYCCLECDKCDV